MLTWILLFVEQLFHKCRMVFALMLGCAEQYKWKKKKQQQQRVTCAINQNKAVLFGQPGSTQPQSRDFPHAMLTVLRAGYIFLLGVF